MEDTTTAAAPPPVQVTPSFAQPTKTTTRLNQQTSSVVRNNSCSSSSSTIGLNKKATNNNPIKRVPVLVKKLQPTNKTSLKVTKSAAPPLSKSNAPKPVSVSLNNNSSTTTKCLPPHANNNSITTTTSNTAPKKQIIRNTTKKPTIQQQQAARTKPLSQGKCTTTDIGVKSSLSNGPPRNVLELRIHQNRLQTPSQSVPTTTVSHAPKNEPSLTYDGRLSARARSKLYLLGEDQMGGAAPSLQLTQRDNTAQTRVLNSRTQSGPFKKTAAPQKYVFKLDSLNGEEIKLATVNCRSSTTMLARDVRPLVKRCSKLTKTSQEKLGLINSVLCDTLIKSVAAASHDRRLSQSHNECPASCIRGTSRWLETAESSPSPPGPLALSSPPPGPLNLSSSPPGPLNLQSPKQLNLSSPPPGPPLAKGQVDGARADLGDLTRQRARDEQEISWYVSEHSKRVDIDDNAPPCLSKQTDQMSGNVAETETSSLGQSKVSMDDEEISATTSSSRPTTKEPGGFQKCISAKSSRKRRRSSLSDLGLATEELNVIWQSVSNIMKAGSSDKHRISSDNLNTVFAPIDENVPITAEATPVVVSSSYPTPFCGRRTTSEAGQQQQQQQQVAAACNKNRGGSIMNEATPLANNNLYISPSSTAHITTPTQCCRRISITAGGSSLRGSVVRTQDGNNCLILDNNDLGRRCNMSSALAGGGGGGGWLRTPGAPKRTKSVALLISGILQNNVSSIIESLSKYDEDPNMEMAPPPRLSRLFQVAATSPSRRIPLLFAAAKLCSVAVVETLLDFGAAVNTVDYMGRNCLHWMFAHTEMEKKPTCSSSNDCGSFTPEIVCEQQNTTTSPTGTTKRTSALLSLRTPKIRSTTTNRSSHASLIWGDVMKQDLHRSADEMQFAAIVELLCRRGCDVEKKDIYGLSPCDMARALLLTQLKEFARQATLALLIEEDKVRIYCIWPVLGHHHHTRKKSGVSSTTRKKMRCQQRHNVAVARWRKRARRTSDELMRFMAFASGRPCLDQLSSVWEFLGEPLSLNS